MISDKNIIKKTIYQDINEEVSFSVFFSILKRNKKIIFFSTFASFLICCFYLLNRKNIWEGNFQIVLTKNEMNTVSNSLSNLKNKFGISKGNELKTEVEVLKSPSVLLPIYKFVKLDREASGLDVKKITYKNWLKDQLAIGLEQETSVLNVTYLDTNKELILPVLGQITLAYKEYSGRNRKKSLKNGIDFLNNQININKIKSLVSLKEAQSYAFKHNLQWDNDKKEINVVRDFLKAQIQIESFENKLIQLNNIKSANELLGIALSIENLKDDITFRKLKGITLETENMSWVYKENDDIYKMKLLEKKQMFRTFKDIVESYYEAELINWKSKAEESQRPQNVLSKYRELINNAKFDMDTLTKLETERRALELEKARSGDPWELITKPTLLEEPINTSKIKIVLLSLIIGPFIGFLLASNRENYLKLVFSEKEFEKILNTEKIVTLKFNNDNDFEDLVSLFIDSIKSNKNNNSIAIIPVGTLDSNLIKQLLSRLNRSFDKARILYTKDIYETKNSDLRFVVSSLNDVYSYDLEFLQEKLSLLKKELNGWIKI